MKAKSTHRQKPEVIQYTRIRGNCFVPRSDEYMHWQKPEGFIYDGRVQSRTLKSSIASKDNKNNGCLIIALIFHPLFSSARPKLRNLAELSPTCSRRFYRSILAHVNPVNTIFFCRWTHPRQSRMFLYCVSTSKPGTPRIQCRMQSAPAGSMLLLLRPLLQPPLLLLLLLLLLLPPPAAAAAAADEADEKWTKHTVPARPLISRSVREFIFDFPGKKSTPVLIPFILYRRCCMEGSSKHPPAENTGCRGCYGCWGSCWSSSAWNLRADR